MPTLQRASLLTALRAIQLTSGYLRPNAVAEVAERCGVSESYAYGVASFYSLLDLEPKGRFVVRVCDSVSCHLGGSNAILEQANAVLGIRAGETTADGMFTIETVSCLGACGAGPAAMVNDRLYTRLDAGKFAALLDALKAGCVPSADGELSWETARSLGDARLIGDPSLNATLPDLAPEEILSAVEMAGLRGRGGAAFPVSRKWRLCAEAPGDVKYIICNADEGEPGTFKDRYLLTEHADLVIGGMALAARAVGASKGYIYLRGEYTDAEDAIRQYLGGTDGCPLDIEIALGAGAYVCGEETALLESIEGRRGVPRLRPPYPPVSGVFGCPTIINNVETFANVPLIIANGPQWYAEAGTTESPGTKLFSVSGDVTRPGIIEAPFGTPLLDVLKEAGAVELKAALVGGASGRIVPPEDFGRRLCYGGLSPGAGAIIAIGKDRSLRDLATNLMTFFEHESCGECAPCRIGTARAREILAGEQASKEGLSAALQSLGETLANVSRCGLGQTAPGALFDMLRLFPEEFEG
ncbi:MAG: NAD(P)H-dependent oxidoreductase subunit E [Armatimonadota bacterium]|nr:NAD(P)H-dependent oxidoreductase subunit E [Armatimonadota bacterium]